MAVGWRGSYLRYREFFLNVLVLYKKRADLRAFFEIILSLTTIAVFLLFALKPTVLTIIDLLQQIEEKRSTVQELNVKINNLQTAQEIYSQNQALISNLDVALTTKASPDLFAKQIQGLAAKNSVSLSGLSIGEITLLGVDNTPKNISDLKPIQGNPKEMPVSISAKGSYASLLTFVKDLENLRMTAKIDALGVTSSQTEAGQVIVVVISGRVPFLEN